MICNVCEKNEAIGVASSSMGAVSIAYCQECLQSGREPYWILVGGLIGLEKDHVADWVKPVIEATLKAEGKTEDELWEDVDRSAREYREAMEKEYDK